MKTRLRTHSMPGDIPKADKIALLEGKKRGGKTFKKVVRAKERAVLKRRGYP
jgi:hypothetical protein